jgi:hypothetical protein
MMSKNRIKLGWLLAAAAAYFVAMMTLLRTYLTLIHRIH